MALDKRGPWSQMLLEMDCHRKIIRTVAHVSSPTAKLYFFLKKKIDEKVEYLPQVY